MLEQSEGVANYPFGAISPNGVAEAPTDHQSETRDREAVRQRPDRQTGVCCALAVGEDALKIDAATDTLSP